MERQDPPAILGPYNLIDIGTGTLATFGAGLGLFHRAADWQGPARTGFAVPDGDVSADALSCSTIQAARPAREPRGYMTLGTGSAQPLLPGAGRRWFFLALPPDSDASPLAQVDGLSVDGLTGDELERSLEQQFASRPASEWVERLNATRHRRTDARAGGRTDDRPVRSPARSERLSGRRRCGRDDGAGRTRAALAHADARRRSTGATGLRRCRKFSNASAWPTQ